MYWNTNDPWTAEGYYQALPDLAPNYPNVVWDSGCSYDGVSNVMPPFAPPGLWYDPVDETVVDGATLAQPVVEEGLLEATEEPRQARTRRSRFRYRNPTQTFLGSDCTEFRAVEEVACQKVEWCPETEGKACTPQTACVCTWEAEGGGRRPGRGRGQGSRFRKRANPGASDAQMAEFNLQQVAEYAAAILLALDEGAPLPAWAQHKLNVARYKLDSAWHAWAFNQAEGRQPNGGSYMDIANASLLLDYADRFTEALKPGATLEPWISAYISEVQSDVKGVAHYLQARPD